MDHDLRLIEAILFASAKPVAEQDLADRLPEGADVPARLAELAADYRGRGICLARVAGGWTFRTAQDLACHLRFERSVVRKPSRAAVETLAVIAYHQPVTRGEVEHIRGVAASRGTFDILLEAGWIRPVGRRAGPGRAITWGTTAGFLEHFGLAGLAELPGLDELEAAGLIDTRPASAVTGIGGPDDDADTAADANGAADAQARPEPRAPAGSAKPQPGAAAITPETAPHRVRDHGGAIPQHP